jgi:ABC-type multidrug transport system ATPase subunit
MKILIDNLGKKYNRQWVFKNFSFCFEPGSATAITGKNGSGKSTLLQCILGFINPSSGKISYRINNKNIIDTAAYVHCSFAAPYQELIEEMTLQEMIRFHQKFKPFYPGYNLLQLAGLVNLENALNKQIGHFSSGMKQRLKLGLTFFSRSAVLMLDEPTSNLDQDGIQLYQELVALHTNNRTIIVSSNDPQEYRFCKETIQIERFSH